MHLMILPAEETLHLLLLDASSSYKTMVSSVLRGKWPNVDFKCVDTLDALEMTLKSAAWDAVLVSFDMAQHTSATLKKARSHASLFILCTESEEEEAFTLIDERINDIVSVRTLKRLPLMLRREQERRVLQRHYETSLMHTAQAALDEPLRRSEIRFRAVIEGFNDVILIIDNFHVIRYANQALQRVLGYSVFDMVGRPLSDFLQYDEEDVVAVTVESLLEANEAVQTFEHSLLRQDGRWEIMETTGQSNVDPAGQPMVLLHMRCITSRKQAEQSLRESEQRFQAMADAAPAMIWVTDKVGMATFLSLGWREFTGQTEEVTRGYGWLDALHPDDRARTDAAFAQAMSQRGAFQIDYRLRRYDGEYRWAVDSGRPNYSPNGEFIGYIGSVIDIHERKKAEQALRQSENRYRRVIEDQTEFICRYMADFRLTFVNRAYSEAYGYQPEDMVGISLLAQISWIDRDRAISDIKALSPSNPVATAEYKSLMPDGTVRWFQWTHRVLLDDNGQVVEYQGVGRDITDRHQAEKELEALYNATSHLFKADSVRNLGQQIVETVVQEFEQADCGLMLVDKNQGKIIRLARTGQYNIQPDSPLMVDGRGLVPLAIRTGRIVYVPDVTLDMRYIPSEVQTRSELVIPLKTSNGVIAVLDLQRSEVDAFSERDQRILLAYAERAAVAIENMQLYEQINRYNAELESRVAQRTAQLNEAKDRVEAILNNSPDGILLTNLNLGIQQTNFAFDRLFACETDAFFDASLMSLMHPNDAERVMKAAQQVMLQHKGKNVEVRARRKDGSIFDAELSIGYVGVSNTQDAGLVCIIHDITARKRAEQALEESHRFTQRITETAPNIIYLFDIQEGETIYINRNLPELMGHGSDDAFLNRNPLRKLMHPEDAARLSGYLGNIKASVDDPIWEFEYRLSHKTEGWRWFLSRDTTFRRDENGRVSHILGTATDITERKQIEEALREGEEKFRLLVEAAPVAIVITDQSGRITLVNIQAEILFGYNRDVMIEQPVEMLMPEMKREGHVQHRTSYVKTPHMRQMGSGIDLFAQCKDGSQVPVEIQLSYVETQTGLLVMAFIVDITERKERERQLRYHASLQENVTDAVIATDLNFHIQSWNRAAERIYGWRKEDVLGRPVTEVLGTQFASGESARLIERQFLEQGHWTDEVTQYHRDGTPISILSSVVLFKDEQNRSLGVVAVNHDITSRKQAEEALYQALAHEKELSELKSRFVSMASHEFRTPLASILALTETLSAYRKKLTDVQIEEKFGKIKEQVDYLKETMEDVLLLGKIQAKHIEFTPVSLDIHALCQSVIDEFRSHPTTHHQLVYTFQGTPREVRLDKNLMRRIINNLVTNAIKYSPQGNTVTISLALMDDHLQLDVEDEGIGIPASDLKHLFQPFHRATNVGTISGTGLGLVITKEAVELHGGTIKAVSQLDMGTTFTVTIPLNSPKRK